MRWTQQDLDNYHAAMARMRTPEKAIKAQKHPTLNEKAFSNLSINEGLKSRGGAKKGKMNKTEANYALQLAALKQTGEIYHYGFEEVTLKLADGTRYTPDFFVVRKVEMINFTTHWLFEFHEIKGGYIWEDAKLKFKWARKQHSWFRFKMMQCIKGQWNEIYPEN